MIKELLTSLAMKGALSALDGLNLKDQESILNLLQAEHDYRQSTRLKRKLSQAKFPVDKDWCDIDPTLNPQINFKAVEELGAGDFTQNQQNICLLGQQGTGKTHSLIALGRQLCRKGVSVRFYTACGLVNVLEEAKSQNTVEKLMMALLKPSLLIIDELGFVPFSDIGSRLLFDVFSRRYEKGSIAISTNLSFDKWTQVFGAVELTAALIDRFTHKAHIFTYEGQSVRFLAAKQRKAQL